MNVNHYLDGSIDFVDGGDSLKLLVELLVGRPLLRVLPKLKYVLDTQGNERKEPKGSRKKS